MIALYKKIFIFSILIIISKIKESSKNLLYNESNNLYLKFIDFVINFFDNDFIFFYQLYDKYNKDNEKYQFVPKVIIIGISQKINIS